MSLICRRLTQFFAVKGNTLKTFLSSTTNMPKLLYISVSPRFLGYSRSREVADEFLAAFKEIHPDWEVVNRDLNANPVPHLDGIALAAAFLPEEQRSEEMKAKHQYRLELIEELLAADEIVLSTPMWNWCVPSVLKAYIDLIVMRGVLDLRHAQKLDGKRVSIFIACGAGYGADSMHPELDFETGYLRLIFTALGSKDVEIIRSEYCLAGIVPGMESLVPKKEESFIAAKAAAIARVRA